MAKKTTSRWKNIDSLIRGDGDVTLGRVGPLACAAVAADGSNMLVALVRRPRESFEQLLDRLDAALQKCWDDFALQRTEARVARFGR